MIIVDCLPVFPDNGLKVKLSKTPTKYSILTYKLKTLKTLFV